MLSGNEPLSDQALPGTMVGKLSTWSNRALHYPIFSPTWFQYRARGFLIPMGVFTFFCLIFILISPSELNRAPMLLWALFLWLAILTLVLLGRWLAVKVRTRARQELWSVKKEVTGISLVLALGMLCATVFIVGSDHFGSQMLPDAVSKKPGLLQQSGNTTGKASTTSEESKSVGFNSSSLNSRETVLLNLGIWGLIMIWLGGPLDLRAWFRQKNAIEQEAVQEKLARYQRERNQAEMRLSVLASQVEPHFLFNTLSGVRSAILTDPERGVLIIDHLVAYLRSTIPQMRSDGSCTQSTLRMQLDSIRSYLGVMHVRIPRLQFTVESPQELLELTVPPLMLISLVENAVKHGIELKKGPVHIAVSANKVRRGEADKLAISVKDNGVGFGGSAGATSGTGIGLSNIRERLKQLYDDQAGLSLLAVETGGVEAIIWLPIVATDESLPTPGRQ
jgi:Histidine kinase